MKLLPKSYMPKLKNKDWYHQRFDGSPLFMSYIALAEVKKEARKPAGTEADLRICFFDDMKADWYLDMKDVQRGSNKIIALAKKNKNISTKLLNNWGKDEKIFDNFFKNFNKINLKELSDNELLKLYEKFSELALNRFTSSSIIDHFALGTDKIIEKMLRKEIGKLEKESNFTNIFSIATAPVHQSFINQTEIELLKIAIKSPRDKKKIEAYQKKYYWSKNNYIKAQNLNAKYFKQEIASWLKSKKDLQVNLKQLKNTPQINKRKKAKLFKKCNFSTLLKTLLKISEDFTWWQDERKRASYLNIDMGVKILNEMAKRRGYDKESVKFLIIPEVKQWFQEQNISQKELNTRMKKSVMLIERKGYKLLTGTEVDKVKKMMINQDKGDIIRDVRGLSAATGKVIGKVKIVNSVREINKVQQGDILIAVMTRPDYIQGMKKAGAIVTNEGGITCHAAIVARELSIPCIIGTKIATQVFKDGDLVEVNANHGWVRKIK